MADTLGVIAGDVRLDSTNFRQGVTTINRQLQMVRTYFDSSAARARAFGDATDQLRIRSQSISRQIDLQRRKVQLLGRAHQEYTRRLGADAAATQRLAIQLNRARAVMTQMEATQRQVNAEMNRTNQAQERYGRAMTRLEQRTRLAQSQMRLAEANARAFGSETDRLRVRQQNLTRQIDLQRQQVTLLSLAYRESARRMGRNAEETRRAAIQLNQARAALAGMQGDLNRLNRQLNQAGALWNRVAGSMRNLRWMAFQASVGLSVFGGSLAVALGSAVKQAIDFEDAFAGVRKTVDATEAQFAVLNEGIREMARTMPQSHEEIARVAEVAGQLGIKQQDLLKFTRTMVDMGVATTMSSDEAATALARLANITQMPMDQIDRLGATVVHLGNNLAATEEEIVEMGLRIAGAGHQVGMAEAEILALAGALSAVGIKAEAGGTAISRVMLQMNTDVQEGGKNLQLFAKVAGMSASQFEKTFKKDAAGAIIAFIEGLGKMKKEGKNVVPVLKELSLNEIRVRDALLRASGAGDLFRRSIQMGNKAWKENSALTKEAQERYKTAASQMKIFRNRINDIKITLGNALIPVLLRALKALEPVVNGVKGAAEWFERLSPITKNAIGIFAGVTAGLLALGTAIAGIVAIANPVSAAIVGISLGVGALSASVYHSSREMTKAREDALRYGEGVSEGAKKAAKGFLDLRDQASVNLAKLRIATGAEAKKIVDETVAIFAQMGDKITAALNKDRLEIQKAAASLLGEVPKELEGAVEGVTNTAIRAIDSQIKRIEEANKVIRKGLVEFGGDIERMPEDFAKRYTQALKDVDQGAQAFAKRIQDLSALTERIQADQGKVTAKGATQWVKEIEKSYNQAEKAAKNWAKSQRETWESAYASGKITRDQYQMITDIIDAEEKKRIDIAKKRRQEALEVLRDSLSEEAYLYDVHTGKVIESQSDLLGQNEYLLKQRGKAAWDAYFDSMIEEGKKADPTKHYASLIKKYGDIGAKSVDEMANAIRKGGSKARGAAEFLAVETRDGFKIDLGDQGLISVESFIKGMKDGTYDLEHVALAHMNQLRRVYGEGSFNLEGLKAIRSFAEGLQGEDIGAIAEKLGLDLKSKMDIDLGRYGKMSAESFAQGLSEGTLSFDAVYAYFRTRLQEGMKVDLSQEGKENIDTLRLGMQVGAIDAAEAAHILGLDLKSKVKVDLGPEGKHNVQTLIQGLQSGNIDVQTFSKGVGQLLKAGAKADLSPEGKATGETQAKGLQQSKSTVKKAAEDNKKTVEKELSQTTDGGGGKKATGDLAKGISGGKGNAERSARSVASGVKSNLKVPGLHSVGLAVAQGFANGIRSGSGIVGTAARTLANAALNKMRSTLAIRSPSRKMMEIGMYTAEGFELGMKKRLAQVQTAANMLAETVEPPTTMGASEVRPVQPAAQVVNHYSLTVTGQTDPWGSSRELMRQLRNLEELYG